MAAAIAATTQTPTTFSDSDNSSCVCYPSSNESHLLPSPPLDPSTAALRLLSTNLETLLNSEFVSDASISVPSTNSPTPVKVPVHRCILAARSPFFRQLFEKEKDKKEFEMKELAGGVEVWNDALMVVLGYLYTGTVGALPKDVCICADAECKHVACRPKLDFMLEVLYASSKFEIRELVRVFLRHLLDILENVAEDDLLVILSVANLCNSGFEKLLSKCIDIVVNSTLDIVTLEKTLPPDIVKQIMDSRTSLGLIESDTLPNKHIRRIHRALDSDDIELVRLLLTENKTTLDDAYALHYAVAHCDLKITIELLDLGIADVNHRNPRNYTVLHVAATRKEPKLIVSLVTKGARPSDTTPDGRKALQISRRLTKLADYNRPTEEGIPTHNDRLCIEILENAETNRPIVGEASVSLAAAGDDLRQKLLYYENRVALARYLFPMEAKIAMFNAKVHGTLEFTADTDFNIAQKSQDPAVDDLNDTPFRINEQRLSRMAALSKCVETARRFFPRCAKKLDELVDNDTINLSHENATVEEIQRRKKRFQELQEDFERAFYEDKELGISSISSSSSSTTFELPRNKIARR